jgi:OTU-like cysteine protease
MGDGNCLFRALSVCLYGYEHDHGILRKSIAKHMEESMVLTELSDEAVRKHIIDVGTDGRWVGEDVIICAADFLQRDINVYIAADSYSPIVYSPRSGTVTSDALRIVFYEPGHYRAVKVKCKEKTSLGNIPASINIKPIHLNSSVGGVLQ